jgi:hypothetical protein
MAPTRRALASAQVKAGPLARRRAYALPAPPRPLEAPLPRAAPRRAAPRGGNLSSKTFWSLMDHWGVGDAAALELIDEPGRLPAAGHRPRFRLTADQTRRLEYLLDIDATLNESWGPADAGKWLARKNPAPEFSGRSPLEHMILSGLPGIAEVLRFLHHWGLKQSLRPGV